MRRAIWSGAVRYGSMIISVTPAFVVIERTTDGHELGGDDAC